MKQSQNPWSHLPLLLLLLFTAACSTTAPPSAPVHQPTAVESLDNKLRQAVELYEAEDYASAETRLNSLRTTYPDHAASALYLGRVYFATERYAEAVDELQKAVDLEGDLALHHLWLGRALGEHVQRVPTLLKLPLAKRIHATFLRAVELDPSSPEAHLALGRFYSEAPPFAGGDPVAARRHAQRLTELDPPAGHRLQGKLFEATSQFEKAEEEYREAIAADPRDAESYRQAGEFFKRQERPELAQEMNKCAEALESPSPEGSKKLPVCDLASSTP